MRSVEYWMWNATWHRLLAFLGDRHLN
jgi:hypothetical protein